MIQLELISKSKGLDIMLRHKAYSFRLYPNSDQASLINNTIGSSRFVYNYFLKLWIDAYENTNEKLNYYKCASMLTELKRKDSHSWLKVVDSIALQTSLSFLTDAFDRFFKGQNGYPKTKRKAASKQSYTTKNVSNSIRINNNTVRLPKLGWVKFAKSREVEGRIMNATITKSPSGRYYISILAEVDIDMLPETGRSVGIDLGISDFAILSDNSRYDNHRFTQKMAQKLKREQRKLDKRKRMAKAKNIELHKAKNYQKQKIKVAKLHERVKHQRKDFLDKLSTDIVKNHDVIAIENLNVKGMLRNKKLAKHISDVSWSQFVSMLKYKAEWYGRTIIEVDPWYPSSQICSNCHENTGKKTLDIRTWTCPRCHATHDRDVNASINILNEGLRIFSIA